MKNSIYLVIHGHFYQPPRENPWTNEIIRQPSAYPYANWNEKINEECFSANTDSRILDGYGHITNIVNNYEYLNFNIGPTLFNWLEKYDKKTYQRIIDADKKSMDRNNGHGNAIAMAYNHPILTLCNDEDLDTQIKWGLEEFRYRFGRESESMWLPETGVNLRVVEKLVDYGIKYIILSPTQADKVHYKGQKEWTDVSNNSIDISKPYFISTSKGKMGVFFYDGGLSSSISFDHLLIDANSLKSRIISATDPNKQNQLISIATDGEIYGHHEPFGDMCLAFLMKDSENNNDLIITNYGNYLEMYPPQEEVLLKTGKNYLGTSWSCSHGVGRWLENCGCKTGGEGSWTQEWRRPFRDALDLLRERIRPIFEEIAGAYVNDVWEARNDYIHYILNRSGDSFNQFIQKHAKKELDPEEKTNLICLMESQLYAMYMYTSCAWFFTEISGIETVQNMKYARRSLEYVQEALVGRSRFSAENIENEFKNILRKAKSNLAEFQNGEWIYENFAMGAKISIEQIISQYLFYKLASEDESTKNSIYFYDIVIEDIHKREKTSHTVFDGILTIKNTINLKEQKYIFYVLYNGDIEFTSYLRKFYDDDLKSYLDNIIINNDIPAIKRRFKEWFLGFITLNDVVFEWKEKILNAVFEHPLLKQLESGSDLEESIIGDEDKFGIEQLLSVAEHYINFGVELPFTIKIRIEKRFNDKIIKEALLLKKDINLIDYPTVERILKLAETLNIKIANFIIEDIFNNIFNEKIKQLDSYNLDITLVEQLIKLINFANRSKINFERKQAENKLFFIIKKLKYKIIKVGKQGYKLFSDEEMNINGHIITLASKLNINVNEVNILLFKAQQQNK